ncbi:MAG: ShlB/FhaC/HecB family hemolysin secretion/activation protein [Candidatus Saccharibacteria bacterium]|nr:ShlB/FhaC/HecB family hemolysin secretion/activation protein [Pseudorhodobacter sp.]
MRLAFGSLCVALAATGIDAQTALPPQSVERNPAIPLQGLQSVALNAAAFAARPGDATPFGVDLRGLSIVDSRVNGGKLVAKDATGGINTASGGPTAQNDALRKRLARFLGRPLSFQLLSQIQTDVTEFYRANGRSLVSVTVPQQEITGGIVQINVTAFVLATTRVAGADAASAEFLQRNVRLKPGQEVDTDRLLEDVNWLNQNPFRQVSVQFEPGADRDTTVLTLQVQSGRTWSGYVGTSNSGSEATGLARVFAGFNTSPLAWKDQQLSYQFTGAPESIGSGRLWDTGKAKGYLSHAISYLIPITTASGFRTKLIFGASHISSYSAGLFPSQAETTVLDAELAVPLRKTNGRFSLVPEIYGKLEYDDYDSRLFFFDSPPLKERTKLSQITLGYRSGISGQLSNKSSRGSMDIGLVFGQRDEDDAAATDYAFAKISLKQEVFFNPNASIAVRVTGQFSADQLHPLSQLALGVDNTVRGYDVNGASGSAAVAGGIEYRTGAINFTVAGQDATFRPHIFADYGFARGDEGLNDSYIQSVGFGGQFQGGDNVVATVDVARTFNDAGTTPANALGVSFQMTVRF